MRPGTRHSTNGRLLLAKARIIFVIELVVKPTKIGMRTKRCGGVRAARCMAAATAKAAASRGSHDVRVAVTNSDADIKGVHRRRHNRLKAPVANPTGALQHIHSGASLRELLLQRFRTPRGIKPIIEADFGNLHILVDIEDRRPVAVRHGHTFFTEINVVVLRLD
jgi:hypothetical protein